MIVMSNSLKIKLNIADRVYPLTVAPEQEEGLRKSAKKIEAMIKQLEQNYAVRDKQDVLAMCALQYATQLEQNNTNESLKFGPYHFGIENDGQKILVYQSAQECMEQFNSTVEELNALKVMASDLKHDISSSLKNI